MEQRGERSVCGGREEACSPALLKHTERLLQQNFSCPSISKFPCSFMVHFSNYSKTQLIHITVYFSRKSILLHIINTKCNPYQNFKDIIL